MRTDLSVSKREYELAMRLGRTSFCNEAHAPCVIFCLPHSLLLLSAHQTLIHKNAMVGIEVVSVGSMRPKGKSYDINVFRVSRRSTVNRKL